MNMNVSGIETLQYDSGRDGKDKTRNKEYERKRGREFPVETPFLAGV